MQKRSAQIAPFWYIYTVIMYIELYINKYIYTVYANMYICVEWAITSPGCSIFDIKGEWMCGTSRRDELLQL